MKSIKRVMCILLVAIIMMSANVIGASAASSKPITLEVKTSTNATKTLGIINVTITVKNVSKNTIKNVVCSSSDSKNIAFYKTVKNNVTVCNPNSKVVHKKDAMTSKLLPGGKMVYSYCIVTGYQNAKTKVSKTTANLMLNQHKQLDTKYFRDIKDISKTKVSSASNLKFGSIKGVLKVTAYYGVSDAEYKAIASISDVSDYSVKTPVTNAVSSNSSSISRPVSNASSSAGAKYVATDTEVVVSATGSKYHKHSKCGNINENNAFLLDKTEAEKRNLKPCEKCYS